MKNKINTTLSNSFKIWSNRRNRDKIDFIYKYSHCSFIIKKIAVYSEHQKWSNGIERCHCAPFVYLKGILFLYLIN